MNNDKFQAIVVGAGPAGSAAAYRMAKAGMNVLLIERGKTAGGKNMTGGRLYGYALEALMPSQWYDAPLEREVIREVIMMITETSSIAVNCTLPAPAGGASYTVLRAKFDTWLVTKAEQAGAMFTPGFAVDSLLVRNGKVHGVKVGNEEIEADIVVLADGANSLLAERAGLTDGIKASTTAIGIKQMIGLPETVISDRFNVTNGQGAGFLLVGACTAGIPGGGFIYSNRDSISIGVVINSAALKSDRKNVAEIIDSLNEHPAIAPIIQGGQLLEYSAHLIPEGGIKAVPRIYGDGYMIIGDAAGLVVNNGFTVRGMDYAIQSGIAAADTAIHAAQKGDFSVSALREYQALLKENVLKDMETFKNAPEFMTSTPSLYTAHPKIVESIMKNIFVVDGTPAKRLPSIVKNSLDGTIPVWQLMKDSLKGVFSL